MPLFSRLFRQKFGPVLLLMLIAVAISFFTRVLLLMVAVKGTDWTFGQLAGLFSIGLFYDLAVSIYIIIPFTLHIWLTNEKMYDAKYKWYVVAVYILVIAIAIISNIIPVEFNKDLKKIISIYFILRLSVYFFLTTRTKTYREKWRGNVLLADLSVVVFLLLLNACSEWFFWEEFSTRYNFIAVDYLVYSKEVLGNIRESYPIFWILLAIFLVAIAIIFPLRKTIRASVHQPMSFPQRTMFTMMVLLTATAIYFLVNDKLTRFSKNTYANELSGNGIWQFGTAFWNNELDFYKFYQTMPDKKAFGLVRQMLEAPNSRFTSNDTMELEREISYNEPEKKYNIVMISVESLSAGFMKAFGNEQNITPYLDSLAGKSIFFTNLYASGTRTVRGLEALSLSIPPPPGQSILKRPDNQHLFTLGSVLKSKGYITQYIYGGYGYFDNMNAFFSANDYEVIDRTALRKDQIHYANIWGVADEDLFTLAMEKLDQDYASGKPFFAQVMTVSNHRPYTYPEGRIDIPPTAQKREGAVKYTDYAINEFLRNATKKPWFRNTIFVIVADHCASAAGSVDLPVTGYHIPMLIYAPGIVQASTFKRMTAQIDIIPTILGLLKCHYKTRFFGQDIFSMPEGHERAFISTYQGLGYLKGDKEIVQMPVRKVREYLPDYLTGKSVLQQGDSTLMQEAMAWYQVASYLIKNKKYNR